MRKSNLVQLGFCTKPHGIKGGVTLHLENSEDSILENGMEVMLFPRSPESKISEQGQVFKIKTINFGNKPICYFENLTDRNVTESLIPFDIFVDRDSFPELEEGEFYISDLIGLDVIDFETREKLGRVTKYFDNTAQIVLTMKINNEFIDLPFVDQFFPEVDVEAGFIAIVKPEVI
ncbi:ribosome maturation factor RimM [Bacteriovorax sp. Seq25_V]|uniref:ribosome maturation factor RimM n=1 Tax=Bacteriovorax sp. Seq25_V TaxID=1201288 RepID=UPI0018DF3BC1|nr:ribosome maturation factor RimM [Bacteriovorax sp. Seq25_V]